MKVAVAVHGTRGDVEPCAALALELMRRGHEVAMAVPPNLVAFVKAAGVPSVVPYGPDSSDRALSWSAKSLARWTAEHSAAGTDTTDLFRWRRLYNPANLLGQLRAYLTAQWSEMGETALTLAADADVLLTGMTYQEVAANVAEYYRIPFAAMHYCPIRPTSEMLPVPLPGGIAEPLLGAGEWAFWRLLKPADDAQRTALGLPRATMRPQRRIEAGGGIEIQAYDKVFYPRLAEEWGSRRPLVGSITLQQKTDVDTRVLDWIDAGSPPVYVGLGSMPVADPAQAVAMVDDVCETLGERALICLSGWDRESPHPDRTMIVESVNHSVVFPRCRAIVHHGGSGTTAAGVRAGVPSVVLWMGADQPAWARKVEELGIGAGQRFSGTDADSLRTILRRVLTPSCAERARAVALQMTDPADSLAAAASLIERAAGEARERPARSL